ncbi:MAG: hypothetical protein ACLPWF_29925 [Bryobacteraceae bacterium]
MLVLFDQGTPVAIAKSLVKHSVRTARRMRWDRLTNGGLLSVAEEAGFDVLLTTDNSLAYQQNLTGRRIAIMVLSKNRWSLVKLVLAQIENAVSAAKPGSYSVVDVAHKSIDDK